MGSSTVPQRRTGIQPSNHIAYISRVWMVDSMYRVCDCRYMLDNHGNRGNPAVDALQLLPLWIVSFLKELMSVPMAMLWVSWIRFWLPWISERPCGYRLLVCRSFFQILANHPDSLSSVSYTFQMQHLVLPHVRCRTWYRVPYCLSC